MRLEVNEDQYSSRFGECFLASGNRLKLYVGKERKFMHLRHRGWLGDEMTAHRSPLSCVMALGGSSAAQPAGYPLLASDGADKATCSSAQPLHFTHEETVSFMQ